ncbi:MAG: acetylglutamate kinase [Polyangiaceae bacterium]
MSETRAIIVELLRNIGGRKEVEQYLKHYCSVDSQRFAVIAISRGVLDGPLMRVAASLSFLREVGLYPIVVHSAGPRLDEALVAAGVERGHVDDSPETTAEALAVIRRAYQQENLALVEALDAQGCPARPIVTGVLEAEPEQGSLFGRVTSVDKVALSSAIRARTLPIVASLATSAEGQLLDVHTEDAAAAVARRVQPHKLIILTEDGGVEGPDGRRLDAINLSEQAPAIFDEPWLTKRARQRLERIAGLLEHLPATSSVSVTSPDHVARELFTHRGAGTLVRRGERVIVHQRFEDVNQRRLRELVETCFGRALTTSYFADRRCRRVYVSENYRATAIVTEEAGMPYLDKFAVTRKAQGEGLGGSVWSRMRADHPQLFWRSRTDNAVNGWYFQQSDGSFRSGPWTVFWYGFEGFDAARPCVEAAQALPPSLAEPAAEETSE